MAKPKSLGADKFHVGQTVILSLAGALGRGHVKRDGAMTTVLGPRVYGEWKCGDPTDPDVPREIIPGWRYAVRDPEDGMRYDVLECQLRALYDDEKLSTWEKFAKKTGIDPRKPVSVRRKRREATNG